MKQGIRVLFISLFIAAAWTSFAAAHAHHQETTDKTGILLVTFGSSYPQAQKAFDNIEENVRAAFPDTAVRWAYTSRMVRSIMQEKGKTLDSPEQALAKMADEGFSHVVVQSLHMIPGHEFHYLASVARAYETMDKGISRIHVGMPLMAGQTDMDKTAGAVKSAIPDERQAGEAVVLVGHGSTHPANASYAALMWQLQRTDENIFIGTISGFPGMAEILARLRENDVEKVWLMPFMSVAGD
ncbi:MAG: sirohydrochlorin cobaltochelatase, partial [Desulfosalsimonadaceae bacterium]